MMMLEELDELFGWLLVFAFAGTIMNYFLKLVNQRLGKKISEYPLGKKIMKILMIIFVRNHKYFGFATVVFLLAHFIGKFIKFGFNITGCIAAILMIVQVLLGLYANVKKKPRKGAWFIAHRGISILIILGIALHLIIPNALNTIASQENTNQQSDSIDVSKLQSFTLDELSQYDGKNGNKAYVAYEGLVYDVTNSPMWKNGKHNGQKAGTDLTEAISNAPHGNSVFNNLDIVGEIK
jgi:predicted heme/steroid binding protein